MMTFLHQVNKLSIKFDFAIEIEITKNDEKKKENKKIVIYYNLASRS